jgi:hypothetical protein
VAGAKRVVGTVRHPWQAIEKEDIEASCNRKGWNMAKKGKGIFLVYADIDAKHDQEFNDWYPLSCRRFPAFSQRPGTRQ